MVSSGATDSQKLAALSILAQLDESYPKEASRGELPAGERPGGVHGWPGAYI